MTLARHARFSKLPEAFTRAFGDPVTFATAGGSVTFAAIVREEADTLNASAGGIGTVGDVAFVRLATADAASLSEGDTFVHQSITFRLASPGEDDGRGMTHFEIQRTV